MRVTAAKDRRTDYSQLPSYLSLQEAELIITFVLLEEPKLTPSPLL